MTENIKATNWPVPAICRHCHKQILVCPVLDRDAFSGDYVVPLVVDSWPEGQQWKDDNKGGFWNITVAYTPHRCDPEKVKEIREAEEKENIKKKARE